MSYSGATTLAQLRSATPYTSTNITKKFRYGDSLTHGAAFDRKDISFVAENPSVQDGGLLRFIIPRRGYVDLTELHLTCQLSNVSPVSGTGNIISPCIDFGSWSIIDRVRVLSGSQQIEQIDNYAHVQNVKHMISGDTLPILQSGGLNVGPWYGQAYNSMNVANRQAASIIIAGQSWIIPLNLKSITSRVLPMKHLPESIIIEVYIKKAPNCCTIIAPSSGATGVPTFTVANAKLRGDLVTVTEDYDNLIKRAISSGGISWRFNSWSTSSRNVQSTTETIQITDKLGCINNIIAVHAPHLFQTTAKVVANDQAGSDIHYNMPDLGVTKYAFRLNGEYFPPDMVQVSGGTGAGLSGIAPYSPGYHAEYFHHLMKALGKGSAEWMHEGKPYQPFSQLFNIQSTPAALAASNLVNTTGFLMMQNFESFQGSELVDGLNSTQTENVFQLVINYANQLPTPVPLLTLVEYEALVSFTKNGVIIIK